MRLIALIGFASLLMSCAHTENAKVVWRPAEIDDGSGKVVVLKTIHDVKDSTSPTTARYIVDFAEYATVVFHENGVSGYYIYDNAAGKYFGTQDFSHYLAALSEIPKRTKIEKFESCTSPWARGLPKADIKAWRRLMSRRRLKFVGICEDLTIVERCETCGIILPPLEGRTEPLEIRYDSPSQPAK